MSEYKEEFGRFICSKERRREKNLTELYHLTRRIKRYKIYRKVPCNFKNEHLSIRQLSSKLQWPQQIIDIKNWSSRFVYTKSFYSKVKNENYSLEC